MLLNTVNTTMNAQGIYLQIINILYKIKNLHKNTEQGDHVGIIVQKIKLYN